MMTLFALATGLRQSNVAGLCWAQVHLKRRTPWIVADKAKGGEDIHISLCDLALEVLERQRGKDPERVSTYQGKPLRYGTTEAWRNALKRAGIADFRWLDLRQSRANLLIQNGTPLSGLQEMGGWKSAAMVRRYAHLAPAHMARHAAVVDGLLRGTSTAQSVKQRAAADAKKGITIARNALICYY